MVLVVAVLAAVGLRAFVVQAFFVPSGSMLPTLQLGDRMSVLKIGYTIHRGDIVVFRRTPADIYTTDADLVKRVIGLPGETISSRGTRFSSTASRSKSPGYPISGYRDGRRLCRARASTSRRRRSPRATTS